MLLAVAFVLFRVFTEDLAIFARNLGFAADHRAMTALNSGWKPSAN